MYKRGSVSEFGYAQSGSGDGSSYREKPPFHFEKHLKQLGYDLRDLNEKKTNFASEQDLHHIFTEIIENEQYTDCVVVIGDRKFACYFMALQIYSRFFAKCKSFEEMRLPSDKCSELIFELIYHWMISLDPYVKILTPNNVLDIYRTSKYLQVTALEEQCFEYSNNFKFKLLKERSITDTAMSKRADAQKLGIIPHIIPERVNGLFVVLVDFEEWVKIDMGAVKDFLNSNHIFATSEMDVFASAVRWLRYNKNRPWPKAQELFACVRFKNTHTWQLMNIEGNKLSLDYVAVVQYPSILRILNVGLTPERTNLGTE